MSFTVESGVPMPKRARGRAPTDFPLKAMAVGDSFLIPVEANDAKAQVNWRRKFHVAKKAFLAQYEGEFKTTTVPDGIRVWRTA